MAGNENPALLQQYFEKSLYLHETDGVAAGQSLFASAEDMKCDPTAFAGFLALSEAPQRAIPVTSVTLGAATSPAKKLDEDTVSYLDRAQRYELALQAEEHNVYLSVLRLKCYDKPRRKWDTKAVTDWCAANQGSPILKMDEGACAGIQHIRSDPLDGSVTFEWRCPPPGDVPARVAFRINCLSTDFSTNKRGGERGLPLELNLETALLSTLEPVHCCGCLVQVYKNGAERKLKTDREKIAKEEDRGKFRPSSETTELTARPFSRARPAASSSVMGGSGAAATPVFTPDISFNSESSFESSFHTSPGLFGAGVASAADGQLPPLDLSLHPSPSKLSLQQPTKTNKRQHEHVELDDDPPELTMKSSPGDLQRWLLFNHFEAFQDQFAHYNGFTLLQLSKADCIQICGPHVAEGIRLYTLLHTAGMQGVHQPLCVTTYTQTDLDMDSD